MTRRTQAYADVVAVVSALLFGHDPEGMGSSVFAPEDEYDKPAALLVAAAMADRGEPISAIVGESYPNATHGLRVAIEHAISLYKASISS
jgi:hypothetical protein